MEKSEKEKKLENAKKILDELARDFAYGKVTFSFENGVPLVYKEERTHKL